MRTFNTGATRDDDNEKLDYDGFLSHAVLQRFAQYMHEHRKQADNKTRASDNWQKGIPTDAYMKSMWRHFMEVWKNHRQFVKKGMYLESSKEIEDSLCAMMFNVMGYMHEFIAIQEEY